MKKISIFFALFLGALFGANAQAAVLSSIKFTNLTQLSQQTAEHISGLEVGKEFDDEALNDAILKLYAQGYFDDIVVRQSGGALEFIVKERKSIARIEIEGVASNDKKQIEEVMELTRGTLYEEGAVKSAAERIKMYYIVKGYFDTIVEYETKPLANTKGGVELIFKVNRGENIIIENVHLSGAQKLDYGDVEPVIANKEREFMGWMWGRNDGALKLYELSNDSARIADEYMKKGYLDAKVSTGALKTDMKNYTADLSYFIKEGQRYKISSLAIENPIFTDEQNAKKLKKLKSKVGKIANIEKIRADIESIQTETADLGYAYARVYPDIQKDEYAGTAAIVFKVQPNEKVYIRNVIITGNSRTNDRVVRRELYLTEGELYHKTDLKESINALRRTSYFDNADIKEERVDEKNIDLIVEIKEASTGSISGGIGYGSTDGLLLNASLSDTNIFGSGLRSVVSVDCAGCLFRGNDSYYSSYSTSYLTGRIGLTNPRIFDSYFSLGGTIYATDYSYDYLYSSSSNYSGYQNKSYGFDITLGRIIARYFSVGLTYNLEMSKLKFSDTSRFVYINIYGYKEGVRYKSSVTPYISFNNTDDYYLPRSGITAGTSLEIAGLGGDERFLSSSTNFNIYYGIRDLIGLDLIFRYKAKFYKIWNLSDEELSFNQKIFLGGIGSMRGFESRAVSPRFSDSKRYVAGIVSNPDYYEVGGTMAFVNSVELSFPIIERVKLRGALFFDYAMNAEDNIFSPNAVKRYSTGVSIEWITPIGPLQFAYAFPFGMKYSDETERFQFTMGQRF